MAHKLDRPLRDLVRACYTSCGDATALRAGLLGRLRRALAADAAFFATADPETLLFTSAFADEPLLGSGARFLENEFGAAPDVNRFADLARARVPIATLDGATAGRWSASARSREIMSPLGLGDELRVALRSGGATWGFLCLHRAGGTPFSGRDVEVLRRIAPHAGAALRRIVAAALARSAPCDDAGGTAIVDDGLVVALTGAGVGRLEELAGFRVAPGDPAPLPLLALVRRLEELERFGPPGPEATVMLTARSGGVFELHAARLRRLGGEGGVAISFAPASLRARTSLRLSSFGLTPAQRRVAAHVLRGLSTHEIAAALEISENTVQDHLKAIFDRVGVASRRELVAALMR